MKSYALSAAAWSLVAQSFSKLSEVSFELRLSKASGKLEPHHVRWGGDDAVSIRPAPIMLHTHPHLCLNRCTRKRRTGRTASRRVCERNQDDCIVGVPSATDIQLTLRCGLLGVCNTHVVLSQQDGAFVLRVHPALPSLFARLVQRLTQPGATTAAAAALSELAFRHPNSVEDDYEDGFDETTYKDWRAKWAATVMKPGVRLFGIKAVSIQQKADMKRLRLTIDE